MKLYFRIAVGGLLLAGGLSAGGATPPRPAPPDPQAMLRRHDATLRAFCGVALVDWATALNMMALPETRLAWSRENGGLFAKPIDSAAFFAHTVLLYSGETEERWTGGVYNPALDQWLLLTFVWLKDAREYRLADFAWVPGADTGPDLAALGDAGEIEKRFRDRLAKALPGGREAAGRMTAGSPVGSAKDRQAAARQAATRLKAYRTRMRSLLAPDGLPEQASLRAAVADLMRRLKIPEPKDKPAAESKDPVVLLKRQAEWAADLFPVFASQKDNARVVTFSSAQDPYKLVLAVFEGGRDVRLVRTTVADILPQDGGRP
ncbi:MAG: hypothetical protein R6X19_11840 [Kiritimatiellia bacterium]